VGSAGRLSIFFAASTIFTIACAPAIKESPAPALSQADCAETQVSEALPHSPGEARSLSGQRESSSCHKMVAPPEALAEILGAQARVNERLCTIPTADRIADGPVYQLTPEFLTEGALRILLRDAHVVPALPAGGALVSNWPGEIFRADGTYIRYGNRSRNFGKYLIKDDQVCVDGETIKKLCRRVRMTGTKTYCMVDDVNQSATIVTIRPH